MSSSTSVDHPRPGHPQPLVAEAFRLGALGAVVGTVSALPAALDRARAGTVGRDEAVREVIRAGARAALATGVGAVAASLAGSHPLVRVAAMVVAGGLTLHALGPDRPAPASGPTPAAG